MDQLAVILSCWTLFMTPYGRSAMHSTSRSYGLPQSCHIGVSRDWAPAIQSALNHFYEWTQREIKPTFHWLIEQHSDWGFSPGLNDSGRTRPTNIGGRQRNNVASTHNKHPLNTMQWNLSRLTITPATKVKIGLVIRFEVIIYQGKPIITCWAAQEKSWGPKETWGREWA